MEITYWSPIIFAPSVKDYALLREARIKLGRNQAMIEGSEIPGNRQDPIEIDGGVVELYESPSGSRLATVKTNEGGFALLLEQKVIKETRRLALQPQP